ncbi:hypothetical protein ACFSAV_00405 [Pasteurella oralis]|uniref:DNA gyrase subunit B n=1 Tax=Pasteurella oralis TaxID=1071947 RepID=A0ABW4NQF7_9PAST
MSRLQFAVNLLLTLVTIAYPIIWLFLGQEYQSILYCLPYIMAGLWGMKGYLQPANWQRYLALMMAFILLLVGLTRTIDTMYWYPVAINVMMLTLFAGSLFSKQSIIERFARLQTPNLPEKAIWYTRVVTKSWCVFFLLNILMTTGFILSEQYHYWALYTGVIAYILMAILMVGEWCIRQIVMKKQEQ